MQKSPPVEVFQYDLNNANLGNWWKKQFETPLDNSKTQISYVLEYLRNWRAKTVVVENEYVDHDFLEDFAEYYVKCFYKYERYCSRLHFFSVDFNETNFDDFVTGNNGKLDLQTLHQHYLGFIIIKPLPQTVIGRTCLKTGTRKSPTENFPAIRKYKVNFFGRSIEIDSLAFQEQDTVVAACATSALWSAFNATGDLFRHAIPSPVEITKLASQLPLIHNRSFPNKGLTIEQMAYAVRKVNLEPFCIGVRDEVALKSNIYAYLGAKIPVVLSMSLYEAGEFRGYHAVTITGFNLETKNLIPPSDALLLTSSHIDKIFVHDDGIGPFAEMKFDGKSVHLPQSGNDIFSLSTLWGTDYRACPKWILIPVYHKIRITLQEIEAVVLYFYAVLNLFQEETPFLFEWEIYLTSVADLKEKIFNSPSISIEKKRELLLQSLPRFIWCAKAKCAEGDELDLFFDATDIGQGELFLGTLEYTNNISSYLKTTQKEVFEIAESSFPSRHPVMKILEDLVKVPK